MDRLDSSLCTQGCGFYGNASFDGMCSKCFKDNLKKKAAQQQTASAPAPSATEQHQQQQPAPIIPQPLPVVEPVAAEIPIPQSVVDDVAGSPSSVLSATPPDDKGKSPSKAKNRCFSCNKKVGLTGFKCRCENLFCGLHRYSDQHDCTFDYKTEGRAKLEKDNPQVVGSKIRKI